MNHVDLYKVPYTHTYITKIIQINVIERPDLQYFTHDPFLLLNNKFYIQWMASNKSTYHELPSYSSDHDETIESNEENPRSVIKTKVFLLVLEYERHD